MIDSHVHMNHEDFRDDFEAVLSRARDAGVTHMVNIGFDLESSRETVRLTEQIDLFYGAVGVHPHDASSYTTEVEQKLEELLSKERIVAVGEIGLDFYRDLSPRDVQREVFVKQIRLAKRNGVPIIIHCRDAFDDVVSVLRCEAESYRGIFHAFGGDRTMAQTVLDLGFHIGIGGIVTFKKSNLADVVAELPSESIVLETDSPYLTPAPFRGKRNEPAYVAYVAKKIAEATGQTVHEVEQQTDQNFTNAMGLKSAA
jgi:TatD DNase family protein